MGIKKRVGIKYCGGCNPSYERVVFVERMKDLFGNYFLFLSPQESNLDLLIFVSGCLRACALVENDPKTLPYFSVAQEEDFENLVSILKSYVKKGDPL